MLTHPPPPLFLDDKTIGVDGVRAIGAMLQRNRTLLKLNFACTQPAFVGASSSLCLESAPSATRNARDFADCFDTSAEETLLVLDALERNSSLTCLDLHGEMGVQATFVQLRGGCRARAAVVVLKQRRCL
jgi:hypothetical protein